MSTRNAVRALAGAGSALLVVAIATPGAAVTRGEDTGDVQATVRKTVLQTATATGEVQTSRMYTQVTAAGSGTKTIAVPVGVESNRNLNAFGPFPMEGDAIVFELDVDGGVEERTLTDADISPMEVSVKVLLDGLVFKWGATTLDDIPVDDIEAIEVFRNLAEIPPEFGGPDALCGVVAVWTRRGGD
jgi:hypothetical protein